MNGPLTGGPETTHRIEHLHAFRGFAILNIVMIHAFSWVATFNLKQPDPSPSAKWINIFNRVLFHDSTIYFALISGLLFTLVLRCRGWPRFFRKKLANVIAPYAVMSLLFTLVQWNSQSVLFLAGEPPEALFRKYLHNLLHGTALFTYWYIPVLAVLFAMTPLLVKLVTGRYANIGICMVAVLPLFFSRTDTNVTLRTITYFAGVYAVGLYLGDNYSRILPLLQRWRVALGIIAVSTSVALVLMSVHGLDKVGTVSLRESFYYLQKLAIAALVLCYMQRREDRLPSVLNPLAKHAFSIYFLHLFVINLLFHFSIEIFLPPHNGGQIIALSLVLLGFTLALSWLFSRTVQSVFGRSSKWLIGA